MINHKLKLFAADFNAGIITFQPATWQEIASSGNSCMARNILTYLYKYVPAGPAGRVNADSMCPEVVLAMGMTEET